MVGTSDGAGRDEASELGALVRSGDQIQWFGVRPVVVLPVVIEVARGVLVEVDVTAPERVLAWTLRSADDVETATRVFGDEWGTVVQQALAGPASGIVPLAAAAVLPDPLARYALVRGIRRWSPAPLDEATLDIDLALAAVGAGRREEAAERLQQRAASLAYLIEDCLAGVLPKVMRPQLLDAARSAAELLGDSAAGAEQASFVAALEAAVVVEGVDLVDDPIRILAEERRSDVRRAPRDVAERAAGKELESRFDPQSVPPRVLVWKSPDERSVRGVRTGAEWVVRVPVLTSVEQEVFDESRLAVSLVDDANGSVVVSAPLTLSDGHVATARFSTDHGDDAVLHVHGAGEPSTLRDADEVHVDRLLLAYWEAVRGTAASGRTARSESTEQARRAQRLLAEIADDDADYQDETWQAGYLTRIDIPNRTQHTARAAAVTALITGTWATASPRVTAPLLAEHQLIATKGDGR